MSVKADLNFEVLAPRGPVAIYGDDRGDCALSVDFRANVMLNVRFQFLVLYVVGVDKLLAVSEEVDAASAGCGLVRTGCAGATVLLEGTAEPHRAVGRTLRARR